MFNFKIQNSGVVSDYFQKLDIFDFTKACDYIAKLPYKRNSEKENPAIALIDHYGTCSTKHASLRKLALEQGFTEVKLILGIFKMNSEYTPKIKNTIDTNHLSYIPEAHNYLKIQNTYFDFTRVNASYTDFQHLLLDELEIEFDEIATKKVQLHQNYLRQWIIENQYDLSLTDIWKIREQCIADLQNEIPINTV